MSGAKVLVVDAGGRGNAVAHAFARSEAVEAVYVAPGNAGSEMMEKCRIAARQGKALKSSGSSQGGRHPGEQQVLHHGFDKELAGSCAALPELFRRK
ncbi:MAG: hypothetical protein NTW84_03775 [Methanothrix sp.]|nr:hypothetical protein [Methanothrix sp.]